MAKNWEKLGITINKIFLFYFFYYIFAGDALDALVSGKFVDVVKEIYSHRIFGPFGFM